MGENYDLENTVHNMWVDFTITKTQALPIFLTKTTSMIMLTP